MLNQGQRELHTTYAVGGAAVARRSAGLIAGLSAIVVACQFLRPAHLANPGLGVGIELTMTFCAVASAGLLLTRFDHGRRLRDMLLLGTLLAVAVVETAFAVPALTGTFGAESSTAMRVGSEALLAIAFAASAMGQSGTLRSIGRRTGTLAGAACVVAGALTALIVTLAAGHRASDGAVTSGLSAAARHPVSLAIVLASSTMLAMSTIMLARRAARGEVEAGLLAAASTLLAAATLQYLASPVLAPSWVTPADALRAAAYALLLTVAFRRCSQTRNQIEQAAAHAAVDAERERIARDLHDGLAQDLAFIATHGQRLTSELGPDHPLSIAAKRALATTRGAIVDLSASSAPTAGAALRQVANELGARFDVRVNVKVAADPHDFDAAGLHATEREEVVRIAREAIVNAVRHGGAHEIEVSLDCRGSKLLLRVSDDGCGIEEPAERSTSSSGFGLPTMQARAESLGGHMTARRSALGGTELEVVVSQAAG